MVNCADCGATDTFTSSHYDEQNNLVVIVLYCSNCTWHVVNTSRIGPDSNKQEVHGFIESDEFDMITR